jgi:hypothetical protein
VPVLRRKLPAAPGAFRLPGGPAIPVAAAALSLLLAASATARSLVAAAIALGVGLVLYLVSGPPAADEE